VTTLAAKLQLKDDALRVVGAPPEMDLGVPTADEAAGLLLFVRDLQELVSQRPLALNAARGARLCWIAYPKGGQLGTDLSRDVLWKAMREHGLQPVRQISIDGVWTALRFRPTADG
jgi:hypothetical protein